MAKFNLFGRRTDKENHDEIIIPANIYEKPGENEEELIAVIAAAISAFLKKPVSGFRVVSFKKRGNWKNII